MDINERIASNIQSLMERRGLNQSRAAKEAGLAHTAIRDILLGKVSSPKVDTLQKIAEVLEVPIGALMNEEGHSELESQLLLAFQALTDDQKALLVLTAQAWTSEKTGSSDKS